MSEYMTIAEIATRWGVSKATIRRMVARGELEAFRLSATLVRVPASEVERVEKERRQERKGSQLRELYGRK